MVKFTDHLHVKLNIFYKPQVKKVISQYSSKITLFDIPSQFFSTFCTKDTKYTFFQQEDALRNRILLRLL
jgi:hypothetical protein